MHGRPRAAVPLYLQAFGLRSAFPHGRIAVGGSELRWDGQLRPTALSPQYEVRIEYKLGGQPKSFLVSPNARELADAVIPDRKIPHIYGEKPHVQMCIFHPGKNEWNSGMQLATSIVPWMSMWLSFFEDWVITDVWSGGGEHPNLPLASAPESPEVASEN